MVLGYFGITVFGGQGSLVGIEHIFGFRDVGHLIGKVVRRRMARLSDFVPEPRASPAKGRRQSQELRAVPRQRLDPRAAV